MVVYLSGCDTKPQCTSQPRQIDAADINEWLAVLRTSNDDLALREAWLILSEAGAKQVLWDEAATYDRRDLSFKGDIAVLASHLHQLPSGCEGPADFRWVVESATAIRDSDLENNWLGRGAIIWDSIRQNYELLPQDSDPVTGVELYHLVPLSTLSEATSNMVVNDGIPLSHTYWKLYAERVGRKHREKDFLGRGNLYDVVWADRAIVWLVHEAMADREFIASIRASTPALGRSKITGFLSYRGTDEGYQHQTVELRGRSKPVLDGWGIGSLESEEGIQQLQAMGDWRKYSRSGIALTAHTMAQTKDQVISAIEEYIAFTSERRLPLLSVISLQNQEWVVLILPNGLVHDLSTDD